jgi:hypothetical protein
MFDKDRFIQDCKNAVAEVLNLEANRTTRR